MAVQDSYQSNHLAGQAGTLALPDQPCMTKLFKGKSATTFTPGMAVSLDDTSGELIPSTGGEATISAIGVVALEFSNINTNTGINYIGGTDMIPVWLFGFIYVPIDGTAKIFKEVAYNATTGNYKLMVHNPSIEKDTLHTPKITLYDKKSDTLGIINISNIQHIQRGS